MRAKGAGLKNVDRVKSDGYSLAEATGRLSQYFYVPMDRTVELNPAASFEDGTIYSNSVTAVLLLRRVRKRGHRVVIQIIWAG